MLDITSQFFKCRKKQPHSILIQPKELNQRFPSLIFLKETEDSAQSHLAAHILTSIMILQQLIK
jgi:hypothetical protein